jgi:hypothetical protein
MPAIEFIGYTREHATRRIERYRQLFASSEYASDFIFILREDSVALTLDGREEPHVVVKSRFSQRLLETCALLNRYESQETERFIGVESFLIQFAPRETPGDESRTGLS